MTDRNLAIKPPIHQSFAFAFAGSPLSTFLIHQLETQSESDKWSQSDQQSLAQLVLHHRYTVVTSII